MSGEHEHEHEHQREADVVNYHAFGHFAPCRVEHKVMAAPTNPRSYMELRVAKSLPRRVKDDR